MARINRVLEYLDSQGDYWLSSSGTCEPGYDDTPRVFANWNRPRLAKAGRILERLGLELGWEDEWHVCDCGQAFRTQPDCYSWTSYYSWIGECDLVCGDCILSDPEGSGYLEELINNPRKADTLDINWEQFGFTLENEDDYETGCHPGQNDSPEAELARIHKVSPTCEVIFEITGTGQFDTNWRIWIRGVLNHLRKG
jgi:hypothetical protein